MSKTVKKKQLILSGIVIVLGAAVLANWYLTSGREKIVPAEGESNISSENVHNLGDAQYVNAGENKEYFASARLSRNEAYDKSVASLKEIISAPSSDNDAVASDSASLTDISDNKITESNIETLVSAKIGGECVCVVNTDSVEVIVEDRYLTDNSVLQIREIVQNNLKISPENITIIGAK